jgi:hypothetical protein
MAWMKVTHGGHQDYPLSLSPPLQGLVLHGLGIPDDFHFLCHTPKKKLQPEALEVTL